jgi:hypothetical protein
VVRKAAKFVGAAKGKISTANSAFQKTGKQEPAAAGT